MNKWVIRAAEVIIKAVEAENTPLRLVLGKPALGLAYKKLDAVKKNLDEWSEVTLSADFPDGE